MHQTFRQANKAELSLDLVSRRAVGFSELETEVNQKSEDFDQELYQTPMYSLNEAKLYQWHVVDGWFAAYYLLKLNIGKVCNR